MKNKLIIALGVAVALSLGSLRATDVPNPNCKGQGGPGMNKECPNPACPGLGGKGMGGPGLGMGKGKGPGGPGMGQGQGKGKGPGNGQGQGQGKGKGKCLRDGTGPNCPLNQN